MKIKTIPSSWIENEGRRLDCGPYMSGAFEAKAILNNLRYPKSRLVELTLDGINGIFKGKMIKRIFVEDPSCGVPFLNTSDMLAADFSDLGLLSRRIAESDADCFAREGTTLVSAAGTIGRTAYVRSEMEGMFACSDIMKIVPDMDKIHQGYLYAYLSSKFGVPLLTSGTFGSIILHIEPSHIEGLPVPRIGNALETHIGSLIVTAAKYRSDANRLIKDAIERIENEASLNKLEVGSTFSGTNIVSSRDLGSRLDGLFHSKYHHDAIRTVKASAAGSVEVREIARTIFEPLRLKRIQVDDQDYGYPFFGTTEIMWAEPIAKYLISKRQENVETFIVSQSTVLIPRSGQLSGIIGTPVMPYGGLVGGAVSEHAIRIECDNPQDAGFIYLALKSEIGRRQLKSRAYGSSIPTLDVTQVGSVLIPDLGMSKHEIGDMALEATRLRDNAIQNEREAITLVERTIEEGGR